MPEIDAADYHDYVIVDGKLVGEFEQMYTKARGIPWGQDKQEDSLNVRLTYEFLTNWGPFDVICDFGAGLGYFLDGLSRRVGTRDVHLVGFDISETATKRGHLLFPRIEFHTLDLTTPLDGPALGAPAVGKRRLFTLRATLWYVFPAIETVVANLAATVLPGELLLLAQNFPPLESSFVGKDVFPEPEAIIDRFGVSFRPLSSLWVHDRASRGNDNWFIALLTRKKD